MKIMGIPRKTLIFSITTALLAVGLYSTLPPKRGFAKDKSKTSSSLFDSKEVKPQGNSVMHFLDARLHKLQEHDPQAIDALKEAVAADPQSSYLQAELARHLAEANQFEQAILASERALKLDPKNPELHLLRGKLYSVKKQSAKAHQEYQTCLTLNPDYEECYTMRATEYVIQQDIPHARQALRQLLKRKPNSTEALFLLASLYTKDEKEMSQAIQLYKKALVEDPTHLKTLVALSQVYLRQKNYDEALPLLLQLEKRVPQDVPTLLRIGLLYYEQENYPEAIARFYKILQLNPKNDRVRYYLGVLESQNKNYEQAAEYFKEITNKSDFYKDATIRLAVVLGQSKKIPEAIRRTKAALKKRQDIPELYDLLGDLYARQEKNKIALKTYDRGLKRFPKQEKLLFSKGVLLDTMGRFEESMAIMKAIIEQNPNNAMALNYLGYSYVDRDIHLQEALQLLQKAHQLKPEDGYIADSLGWAYFKLGNFAQALRLLQKANGISPKEPTILEHLGDVYLKMGEREKAKVFYQKAVSAAVEENPQDKREKEELARIQAKLTQLMEE